MKFRKSLIYSIILGGMIGGTTVYAADNLKIDHADKVSNADLNAITNLNKEQYAFKQANSINLANGKSKIKFNQFYQGVQVFGASLSVTQEQNGDYQNLFGNYFTNIEKDLTSVKPLISAKEALTIGLNNAKVAVNSTLIENEKTETYILLDKKNKARLVYLVSYMVNDVNPSRPHLLIDAKSGKVIEQWEGLTTKDAAGPGGNQKTGQYYYGKDYGYLNVTDNCQMSSPNVDTWDMKNLTSGGVLFQFSCIGTPPVNTYKLVNGAFSPINDAHYFGNVVFNMYKAWFNKSPLTMKLRMRVHYGVNYQNAFWDGQQMTFGDGASYFYPLTALDVVGHEVSHGFTEQNSNLVYSKQPGGINEAFSDMAGEATKYFNNVNKTQRNDWLVGASIIKNGTALRYFADPTKDGRSIGNAKDYYDGLDVHYSSGVFNKAFYTLATKANWNTEKAFRAFVLANQVYWNQTTTFDQGGCGVMKAAKDLNFSTADVVSAFSAVGVNATCGSVNTDVELKNNTPINNLSGAEGSQSYFYVDVPANTATLTVRMSNGTGDADLYVKSGQKPTTTVYDCRPYLVGNNEVCTFKPPVAGRYYVMIRGYLAYNGVTLTASYA